MDSIALPTGNSADDGVDVVKEEIHTVGSGRGWLDLVLPFMISGGLGIGAMIGMTIGSDAMLQEGPAGDMAGSGGALMIMLCTGVGFVVSVLTVLAARVMHRGPPNRLGVRLCLSVVAGAILSMLAWNTGVIVLIGAWALLLGTPLVLTWVWRTSI